MSGLTYADGHFPFCIPIAESDPTVAPVDPVPGQQYQVWVPVSLEWIAAYYWRVREFSVLSVVGSMSGSMTDGMDDVGLTLEALGETPTVAAGRPNAAVYADLVCATKGVYGETDETTQSIASGRPDQDPSEWTTTGVFNSMSVTRNTGGSEGVAEMYAGAWSLSFLRWEGNYYASLNASNFFILGFLGINLYGEAMTDAGGSFYLTERAIYEGKTETIYDGVEYYVTTKTGETQEAGVFVVKIADFEEVEFPIYLYGYIQYSRTSSTPPTLTFTASAEYEQVVEATKFWTYGGLYDENTGEPV
jgi:hypothetical protein